MNELHTTEALERFRRLIAERIGLGFGDDRSHELLELLSTRAGAAGGDLGAYLHKLASEQSGEIQVLAGELTVRETYFFRNLPQLEALRELAAELYSRLGRPIRVLSAGCASGEEPYSVAILLAEALPPGAASVVAFDVNPSVLERARAGRYGGWSLRETPEPLLARWFSEAGREFVLDRRVCESVRFFSANLAEDDHQLFREATFDFVLCRNVLMYFERERSLEALRRLTRALRPGGYLFLGHAETLRGRSDGYQLCNTHGTFYYQREQNEARLDPSAERGRVAFGDAPSRFELPPSSTQWVDDIAQAAARIDHLSRSVRAETPKRERDASPESDLRQPLELLRRERFTEALELLARSRHERADDSDALLLEATLLANAGRLSEAEAVCRQLVSSDELNSGAHYLLALCSAGVGRTEDAVRHDRVAIYLDPSFAMPHLHLGLILKREGDREGARRELGRALVLLEREDSARVLMFGGGFERAALLAVCKTELEKLGAGP